MNEAIAIILTIVVTNWTEIGELKTKDGKTFSVQEGKLQTNTVAEVQWTTYTNTIENELPVWKRNDIKTNRFILKSVQGPVVDTKRVEITNVYFTNIYVMTNYWNDNIPWQTNKIGNSVILTR